MTFAQKLGITDFPFIIKNKNGKVLYNEYATGVWNRWAYDSNGNQTEFENSCGDWEKWKRDSNGRVVRYDNQIGYWENIKYDSHGNEIYYENSDKFWIKREFDSNRKLIHSVNSDGEIIDNRQNIKQIVINEQIRLQEKIQSLANINIVNCCRCGSVLLHEIDVDKIDCFCGKNVSPNDCEDLYYDGIQTSSEFQ